MHHTYSTNKTVVESPDSSPASVRKITTSDAERETSSTDSPQLSERDRERVEFLGMTPVTDSHKKRTKRPSLDVSNQIFFVSGV